MKGELHIGTSGWHYKHWLGTFYPAGTKASEQLGLYTQLFKTVEINNTFYRVPSKETFSKWADAVPDDFIYVVKANRLITHFKKLSNTSDDVHSFLDNASALGTKLGPILFQLPPGLKIDTVLLEDFLKHLPKGYRYAFEFRNHTWYDEAVYQLLDEYKCAFCIYQLAGHLSPIMATGNFVYLRLHGPGGKYQGSYSDEQLTYWAGKCCEWLKEKDVYVYFDNDEKGYAGFNALRLIELTSANMK